MVDSFNPRGVWTPFGPFSMGIVQGPGQIVYLKGQVALDRDGNLVGKGDMSVQTRTTLENIQAVLVAVGGSTRDIFSLTHFVTDIDEFMKTGEIRREFFAEPFPVTTTVQVVRLYRPDALVEITATAEIPSDRFKQPEP
jgi:2-iminobutanoate/2-iminopropanoate deaminase